MKKEDGHVQIDNLKKKLDKLGGIKNNGAFFRELNTVVKWIANQKLFRKKTLELKRNTASTRKKHQDIVEEFVQIAKPTLNDIYTVIKKNNLNQAPLLEWKDWVKKEIERANLDIEILFYGSPFNNGIFGIWSKIKNFGVANKEVDLRIQKMKKILKQAYSLEKKYYKKPGGAWTALKSRLKAKYTPNTKENPTYEYLDRDKYWEYLNIVAEYLSSAISMGYINQNKVPPDWMWENRPEGKYKFGKNTFSAKVGKTKIVFQGLMDRFEMNPESINTQSVLSRVQGRLPDMTRKKLGQIIYKISSRLDDKLGYRFKGSNNEGFYQLTDAKKEKSS